MTSTLTRRQLLSASAVGLTGFSASGWLDVLAARAAVAPPPARKKACIVLWLSGGLSQIDSLDLKPDAPADWRGPFKPIATAVPGVQVCELLPKLAAQMKDLTLLRGMSTGNGDHARHTQLLHQAGLFEQRGLKRPNLGASVSAALDRADLGMPTHVVIGRCQFDAQCGTAGFLGAGHEGVLVEDPAKGLGRLHPAVGHDEFKERLDLLGELEEGFARRHRVPAVKAHGAAYRNAVDFMKSPKARAFDLSGEGGRLRDAYGRNQFGDGCLLARRLVEVGVPFVEVKWGVALGNLFGTLLPWDTHQAIEKPMRLGLPLLDAGVATLVRDLKDRGLLDSTLVVCMGEFGRTPKPERKGGRNHFGQAWTVLLAGGGLKAGLVVGKTSKDGTEVTDRPIGAAELLATVCVALGIDPGLEFSPRDGRLMSARRTREQAMQVGAPVRLFGKEQAVVHEILPGKAAKGK